MYLRHEKHLGFSSGKTTLEHCIKAISSIVQIDPAISPAELRADFPDAHGLGRFMAAFLCPGVFGCWRQRCAANSLSRWRSKFCAICSIELPCGGPVAQNNHVHSEQPQAELLADLIRIISLMSASC
jgi:hypothetical protein